MAKHFSVADLGLVKGGFKSENQYNFSHTHNWLAHHCTAHSNKGESTNLHFLFYIIISFKAFHRLLNVLQDLLTVAYSLGTPVQNNFSVEPQCLALARGRTYLANCSTGRLHST